MGRKAAFQMSLGFIIAVVFAVVLLSLALTWLQSTIGDIGGLTTDLTQQARTKLSDTFAEGKTNFAIWPPSYQLDRGASLRMQAGLQNDAPDGQSHQFIINVIPSAVSTNICPDGNLCGNLEAEMKSWVTYDRSVSRIQAGQNGLKLLEVAPKANARAGTYLFNVVACVDYNVDTGTPVSLSPGQCNQDDTNLWGGAAQPLQIIVK